MWVWKWTLKSEKQVNIYCVLFSRNAFVTLLVYNRTILAQQSPLFFLRFFVFFKSNCCRCVKHHKNLPYRKADFPNELIELVWWGKIITYSSYHPQFFDVSSNCCCNLRIGRCVWRQFYKMNLERFYGASIFREGNIGQDSKNGRIGW